MSYSWKPRPPRRANVWLVPLIATAAIAFSFWWGVIRPPVTLGPCVMLGLATADGLDGPHLVVDCDGTQFGVRAVMP